MQKLASEKDLLAAIFEAEHLSLHVTQPLKYRLCSYRFSVEKNLRPLQVVLQSISSSR